MSSCYRLAKYKNKLYRMSRKNYFDYRSIADDNKIQLINDYQYYDEECNLKEQYKLLPRIIINDFGIKLC